MGGQGDLAGYGSRVGAYLLDSLVVALLAGIVVVAVGGDSDDVQLYAIAASILAAFTYAPLLLCRSGSHNGQTLGKQALGIRVVRHDAAAIGLGTALLREGVGKGLLSVIPLFTLVDFLFPLGDARRQAIHDKLGSTFVVRADAVPDLGPPDPFGQSAPRLGPWDPPTAQGDWSPPAAGSTPPPDFRKPHDEG